MQMTQHLPTVGSRGMLVDRLPAAISKLFRSNQELKRSTGCPQITGLLIDISGNLHVGTTPTPNAVEAFQKLQKSALQYRLCSNSSKESTKSLIERLREMGFVFEDSVGDSPKRQLVWTSLGAVAQLVEDQGLKRPYLLLSASAKEEFIGKIDNVDHGDISQCDSVIIGLAPDMLDYTHLNQAFRILKREVVSNNSKGVPNKPADSNTKGKAAIPIIATHKAKYVQTSTGLSLGPGPFVTALESATGQTAQVVGKPTKSFFEIVLQDLQRDNSADGGVKSLTPEDSRSPQQTAVPGRGKGKIAVIGDDVEADLGEGAIELGLWRILVRTGKYRPGDETRPGISPPDEVFDTFADCIESLLDRTVVN